MGFLPVVKEGPKGMPGLKVDFQTIPIAIPVDMNICIFIYSFIYSFIIQVFPQTGEA